MSIAGAGTDNEKAHKSSSVVRAVACGFCSDMKYADCCCILPIRLACLMVSVALRFGLHVK
jgi:hypothetical protein